MTDPYLLAHQEWLGYLQPTGLVVSPPALVKASAIVSANVIAEQQALAALVVPFGDEDTASVPDFGAFTREVLGWSDGDLVAPPESVEVALPAYQDVLRPTWVVPDTDAPDAWAMLVRVLATGADMDEPSRHEGWQASPQERFERLSREVGVPVGVLYNGTHLRLVYAPKGETSGHLTFPIGAMTEVGGRPILGGLLCLLGVQRVFDPDKKRRLSYVLEESRKYQSTVSNALAGQVLEALHELLRGIQAADDASEHRLLSTVVAEHRDHLYGGLVTVLMRLVFLLYAEDRELLPRDAVYTRNYSIGGLYEHLRTDAGLYPDTMDQRFGAWSHLLALFRLIHDGGRHAGLSLPARHGALFDPDSFPFLEGRPLGVARVLGEIFDAPPVSDGVIWRVLQNLLTLRHKGSATERLSYRTLDVEQIGSVYEAIMGFGVERALGPSIGVKPKHVVVDLSEVLRKSGGERGKFFAEQGECKLPAGVASAVAVARTPEELVAALGKQISPYTPALLPLGSLYLQPGDERRRSGSHYTPRELTAPIVTTTLRPVLDALGERPTPDQLLDLKVCDPAMGSGAFLVEACRQLGEHLVEAWNIHGFPPNIPPDEEPLLHARRLVAQRCLYGVDKNPMAVGLAKLSLWLVTLARDHAFTFLDHALRHGDSLVGFSRLQIAAFRWDVTGSVVETPLFAEMNRNVGVARDARRRLQRLGEDHEVEVREEFEAAEEALADARLKGDLLVAAFFAGANPKAREQKRKEYGILWDDYRSGRVDRDGVRDVVAGVLGGARPVPAFHWEVEFPEVFDRGNGGMDCFVGNPPFLGGTVIGSVAGLEYHDYLVEHYMPATGLADIIAFFFRRCFALLRGRGAFGFIATNTVSQGDTRSTGLEAIVRDGGAIFSAHRRRQWPGEAAVVVSVVHISKGVWLQSTLDARPVQRVSAFLLPAGGDAMPADLRSNKSQCYLGTKIWGAGFLFEASPANGSSSLEDMTKLVAADARNAEVIAPYIGGEEFNSSPELASQRFVIEFEERSAAEAASWPSLFEIVRKRVQPVRAGNKQRNYRDEWWRHANRVPEAGNYARIHGRVLAATSVSRHLSFGFVPKGTIVANSMVVVLAHQFHALALLQSRAHETWARFTGSSMKDDLRYTTPCFETFPFPPNWQSDPALEAAGQVYYDFRAALMIQNNQGLTATYNRFHDPDEQDPGILKLRALHTEMDRAVLHAYGWDDVPTTCAFLLDYEEPDDDDEDDGRRKKKKPWRLRWPDDVRDDVLARLLELNRVRGEEERLAKETGNTPVKAKPAPKAKAKPKGPAKAPKGAAAAMGPGLFGPRGEG